MRLRICLLLISLLLVMTPLSSSFAKEGELLQLFARSKVGDYGVSLDELDWAWLRSKKRLLLGVSAPDYAPFEVNSNGQGFEGITADYVGLLGQLLHLRIEVRRYATRASLNEALRQGEVDLVGTANSFDADDPDLVLSQAFAEDRPVLVTRSDDGEGLTSHSLAEKRVAMLYHYLPPEDVTHYYPNVRLQLYPSNLAALGAVAFGQADVYLGDAISVSHLINRNYLNNLHIDDFSQIKARDFGFAILRSNVRLQRIIDAAIDAIPTDERNNILRRWDSLRVQVPGLYRLELSEEEKQWIEAHARLRIGIRGTIRPLSFFDEDGRLRGITADILAQISLRTSLKFDVVPEGAVNDLGGALERGDIDMLVSDTPAVDADGSFDFTRPYLTIPFVMLSRMGNEQPKTLDEMNGKTLVLLRRCKLHGFISSNYPGIRIVDAQDPAAAAAMVAQGGADATALSLLTAKNLISNTYKGELHITSTVGQEPAAVSFATAAGNYNLISVLNKALLSITPEESSDLYKRWRNDSVTDESFWFRHGKTVALTLIVAAVLLLLVLVWNAYLRNLIRKRQEAESALNNQMMFMRALIDGTPHPIYVRDRQGRLLLCNSAYLDVFGVTRESVVGKTLPEAFLNTSQEAQGVHDDYMRVMQLEKPMLQDRKISLLSGREVIIYHWILPYWEDDGRVVGIIGGWVDISDRQHLLEELKQAKESADSANRAKTSFLATMSHEIRTPINAVIGMLELASKKADQAVVDRFALEVASVAAQDLLEVIGDILDIARIESGHLYLTPERANLASLIESVVRVIDGLARQKHLNIVLDMDVGTDCDVKVDPLRFKQILTNLLSNAVKFTANGRISVSVRTKLKNDNGIDVCLRVMDTGEGISLEDQQHLFSPFSQASNNNQSARSGSGLGLMICKTLCEMMEGRLALTSVLGRGTQVEVRLSLPLLEPLSSTEINVEEPIIERALNILVVDDYPANRMLLMQQLSYLGHRVRDAVDGVQGLVSWRNGRYDVVITDCNMANMNGYELTRAIREHELSSGVEPCRIFGFTANAQPDERLRCREAGMDDCLFKPVNLHELRMCLASVEPWVNPMQDSFAELAEDHLDLSNLERLACGNTDTVISLLDDLLRGNYEDLRQLLKLFSQHDLPGLSGLAHRVKGGARIIVAKGLVSCCDRLEQACSSHDDALLTPAVDALYRMLEEVIEQFESYREQRFQ